MIGLMGDAKNPAQLIVNSNDKAPTDMGKPHNTKSGLIYASEEMMNAFDSRDKDSFARALESFVKMVLNQTEVEEKEEEPEMEKMESGGWS